MKDDLIAMFQDFHTKRDLKWEGVGDETPTEFSAFRDHADDICCAGPGGPVGARAKLDDGVLREAMNQPVGAKDVYKATVAAFGEFSAAPTGRKLHAAVHAALVKAGLKKVPVANSPRAEALLEAVAKNPRKMFKPALRLIEPAGAGTHKGEARSEMAALLGVMNAPKDRATPHDWDDLTKLLLDGAEGDPEGEACEDPWCSPIYSYWLDEAGVGLAIERLADRVENGPAAGTQPLSAVHVKPSAGSEQVSRFIAEWQQSVLSTVEERRKLYEQLYGFPLLIGAAVRGGATVDTRAGFAPAFHGFLQQALTYYDQSRDTQVIPNFREAKLALRRLFDVLAEGDEGMRYLRARKVRAQIEYEKVLLGGHGPDFASSPSVAALPVAMANLWAASLPGRPGLGKVRYRWESITDDIAARYRWLRPSARDYRDLAEAGELILVLVRRASGEIDGGTQSDGIFKALLELLETQIERYTSAYQNVAQVDLRQPSTLEAPAVPMSRIIKTPPVPPLRRVWPVVA